MKKLFLFTYLATHFGAISAQEISVLQDAASVVKELGTRCKKITVDKDVCVITYFKEVKNSEGEVIDWLVSKKPSGIYRVLLGKTADQKFVIQDFYSNGQKQSDALTSVEKNAILSSAYPEPLKTTQQGQVLWSRTGAKVEVNNLVDGLFDGQSVSWYENGQKKREGQYINGFKNGLWTDWYENGQKSAEFIYVNGVKEGKVTFWYSSGHKFLDGSFVNGQREGLWTTWYPSGGKDSETQFVADKAVGLSTAWYENGQKFLEANYVDGELVDTRSWTEDGIERASVNTMGKK